MQLRRFWGEAFGGVAAASCFALAFFRSSVVLAGAAVATAFTTIEMGRFRYQLLESAEDGAES
jgi:hypothetical protein